MSARLTWPGLVVMLGLTLVPGPALAKDCTREMPLPADARLVPRAADAPDDVARFARAWVGAWRNRDGSDGLCTALIVEEVFANGIARVIYSHGVDKAFDAHVPNYRRATGQIADGVLRFVLPGPAPGPLPFAFAFDDGKLNGTYPGEGNAALSRIRDLGDLGCPRPTSAGAPRPSTGAPRERLTADELLAAARPISGLCLRLQRGCRLRGWGRDDLERGREEGREGVDVDYAPQQLVRWIEQEFELPLRTKAKLIGC